MGAPTVVTHGSDAQKERYLRPLFTGEEIWCQMFSEPGAGSDVASLSTKAVRDGEEWVVNGQKVWTTLAHLSRWGMLVARTDPDQPKHKGMTYFVVDMQDPGVEVRPLYQITGEAEFNEVYLTDVKIPDAERLGDVGEGWGVALTTLMNERVSIGGQISPRGGGFIGEVVKIWRRQEHRDPALRDRLMRLWIRGRGPAPDQHPRRPDARRRQPRSGGLDRQVRDGRAEQAPRRVRRRPARAGGDALPVRVPDGPAAARDDVGRTRSRPSCGCGRTPSRAAPPRS